jgi:hypothetical protein
MNAGRWLLPGLCLLLAACHTTRFASGPRGEASDCDAAWVGHWQVAQARADGAMHDAGLLEVPAGCQPIRLQGAQEPAETLDDYRLGFVAIGGLHLVVATPVRGGAPGVMLFRYEVEPRRIVVHDVDHLRVARRILAGTLPGHSAIDNHVREGQAQANPDSIDNLVTGDGGEVAALLQADPALFQTQPWLVLQRTGDAP